MYRSWSDSEQAHTFIILGKLSLPRINTTALRPHLKGMPPASERKALKGQENAQKKVHTFVPPPPPCACTALSKHGVGVEPPF